jgi:hypothetical protein
MSALPQKSPVSTPTQTIERPPVSAWRVPNPLAALDSVLRRDEADILLIAGNIALVALEVIEWPVAALTLATHAIARSRFKALQAVAEVAEEAD